MKKLSAGALVVFMLLFIFTSADLLAAEKTKKDVLAKVGSKEVTKSDIQAYAGLYYVLMGRLSPLDGIGPKEIRLERLLKRATDGAVREVVLATNFTNEGEATAHYIAEMLRARGIRATRIARGVPLGGELEYVDVGTISQALLDRRGL